jgi:HAD superfamily hydrolase (TIGR01509 family)
MLRGVLFDMDGVLVDSEEFMCSAAIRMFEELAVKVRAEDFTPFVGMGENRYLGGVAAKYNIKADIEKIKARAYAIFETLVRGKLESLPGAHEFIERCRKRNLKLALATSADRVKMEVNLREIGLPPETFNTIITGLDIENKKPFPDIYIKAAGNLGLEPKECLVVEDAVSGIEAGKRAGCRCLAVTTSFKASELAKADWVCNSLLDVPEEVLNW